MKGEGKLHTKAFGRFQDVNGNVDRVENSGLGRLSFFLGGVFYYYLLCTIVIQYTEYIIHIIYISDKLSIPDFVPIYLLTLFIIVNKLP